jgi:hypothetical protein
MRKSRNAKMKRKRCNRNKGKFSCLQEGLLYMWSKDGLKIKPMLDNVFGIGECKILDMLTEGVTTKETYTWEIME